MQVCYKFFLFLFHAGGPVAGSVIDTGPHFDSDASNVDVGYWYGLVLLKMSWLDLFGSKMA